MTKHRDAESRFGRYDSAMPKLPEGVTQFAVFAIGAAIFGPLAWFMSGGPEFVNALRMASDPPRQLRGRPSKHQ